MGGREPYCVVCIRLLINILNKKELKEYPLWTEVKVQKTKHSKEKGRKRKCKDCINLLTFFFHNLILLILHLSFCHFHWILFLLFFSHGNGNTKNVPFWLLYFFLNITLSIDDQLLLIINLKINNVPIFLCIVIHRMVSAAWWMEGVWDIITGLPIIIIIIMMMILSPIFRCWNEITSVKRIFSHYLFKYKFFSSKTKYLYHPLKYCDQVW